MPMSADLSDLNKLVPSVQLNGTINGRVPTGYPRHLQRLQRADGGHVLRRGHQDRRRAGAFGFVRCATTSRTCRASKCCSGPQSTLGGRTAASGMINLTHPRADRHAARVRQCTTADRPIDEYRVGGFPVRAHYRSASMAACRLTRLRTPYPITNLMLGTKTNQECSARVPS